jgi:HEAT repeat protein
MRWPRLAAVLLLAFGALLFFCSGGPFVVLGLLRGEHFYRGLPTGCWELVVLRWARGSSSIAGRPLSRPPTGLASWLGPMATCWGLGHGEPPVLRGGPESLPVLLDLAETPNLGVRREAVCSLGRWVRGPDASVVLAALRRAFEDPDPNLWMAAARDLVDAGPEEATAVARALLTRPREASDLGSLLLQAPTPVLPLVPELGVALRHKDREVRDTALCILRTCVVDEEQLPDLADNARLAALARLHGEGEIRQVLPVVRQLLGDPDPLTRVFAAEAVWSVCRHPAEPLPILVGVLHDPDEAVRWHALRVLKEMGCEAAAAAPALVARFNEPCESVLQLVEETLARIGPDVVPLLLKAMHERVARIRARAIYVLGRIGPPAVQAVPALSEAVWDEDAAVRGAALWALASIKANSAAGTANQ